MAFTRNYFKVVRVFPDPSDYFYIKNETLDTMRIDLSTSNGAPSSVIEFSTDKVNWITGRSQSNLISCPVNGKVYIRTESGSLNTSNSCWVIKPMSDYSLGGNIKSLIDYKNMESITSIPDYCFRVLFQRFTNEGKCISVDDVVMTGITALGKGAFYQTFYNQNTLQKGLDLSGITSIDGIDTNSGSLYFMYSGCSSLVEATTPNVTTYDRNQFWYWLSGVSNAGVVKAPTGLNLRNDESGVPSGWTVERYN